jgi:hypothetical protein
VAQRTENKSGIESGLNSEVECGGRRYHVQTQCSTRGAPIIESLAFRGGETLVRITASYQDVAQRLGFNGDDGRHLLELQHADLVQKIRHGMLRDDESDETPSEDKNPLEDETPHFIDASGARVDPDQIDDPAVCELLRELGVAIDGAGPEPDKPKHQLPPPPRPWWRRVAVNIRLPF